MLLFTELIDGKIKCVAELSSSYGICFLLSPTRIQEMRSEVCLKAIQALQGYPSEGKICCCPSHKAGVLGMAGAVLGSEDTSGTVQPGRERLRNNGLTIRRPSNHS